MIGEGLGCPADEARHQRCLAEARRGGDDQVAPLRVLDKVGLFGPVPPRGPRTAAYGLPAAGRRPRARERVPWLVVDDLGTERPTDWAAEVLFRVFNVRYTARAHTLVVSNVQPEEMPGPRLRSRFLDVAVCQVVSNSGEDYRQCRDREKTD